MFRALCHACGRVLAGYPNGGTALTGMGGSDKTDRFLYNDETWKTHTTSYSACAIRIVRGRRPLARFLLLEIRLIALLHGGGTAVRHEQPGEDVEGEFFTPTADQSLPLAARSLDRFSTTAQARDSLDTLAALSHTLMLDLAPPEALQRALSYVALLLVGVDRFRVYAVDFHPHRLLALVGQFSPAQPSSPVPEAARDSLGLGSQVDEQVLNRRQAVRFGGTLCAPLLSATQALYGVLVVECREPDEVSASTLAVVSDHLGLLLERRRRLMNEARSVTALSAIPSLAIPEELRTLDKTPGAASGAMSRWDAAEWSIIRRGARAMSTLAESLTVLALRMEPGGAVSAQDASETPPELLTGDVATPLRVLFDGAPRMLSEDRLTTDFPALLDRVRRSAATPTGRVGVVLTLPVTSLRGTPLAFILTFAAGRSDLDTSIPTLAALASASGAGCQAVRLSRSIAEEAQARDTFISFAAHELRSPVTSTKGYAQLLARQARKNPLPEAMLHSVQAIEEQSGRMGDLVGELLDASRIRRGALDVVSQKIDAVPLIEKLVERVRARNGHFLIELQTLSPSLIGMWDPQRVEQIVRDVLDNAMRFSPENNHIFITMESVEGVAWITVRDEGIGVPPDEREHIFDYLYRAPSAQRRNLGGLGLGLYVSRFLAERMGGVLDLLESSVDAPTGSVFRLSLPLTSS